MYTLIRKTGKSVILKQDGSDELIEIKILKVATKTGRVNLGISVPKDFAIRRKERYEPLKEEKKDE